MQLLFNWVATILSLIMFFNWKTSNFLNKTVKFIWLMLSIAGTLILLAQYQIIQIQ